MFQGSSQSRNESLKPQGSKQISLIENGGLEDNSEKYNSKKKPSLTSFTFSETSSNININKNVDNRNCQTDKESTDIPILNLINQTESNELNLSEKNKQNPWTTIDFATKFRNLKKNENQKTNYQLILNKKKMKKILSKTKKKDTTTTKKQLLAKFKTSTPFIIQNQYDDSKKTDANPKYKLTFQLTSFKKKLIYIHP